MKLPAITLMITLGLASTAMAQGTANGKAASPSGSSKSALSEIRTLANELQGHTEKLRDLMNGYRSLVEQKPHGNDEQLEKWSAAVERQLARIGTAHASVVEAMQRLDQATKGQTLPTALAKDVANAHNEADAERAGAEQALKSKPPTSKHKSKKAPPAEKPAPPLPDDLDL